MSEAAGLSAEALLVDEGAVARGLVVDHEAEAVAIEDLGRRATQERVDPGDRRIPEVDLSEIRLSSTEHVTCLPEGNGDAPPWPFLDAEQPGVRGGLESGPAALVPDDGQSVARAELVLAQRATGVHRGPRASDRHRPRSFGGRHVTAQCEEHGHRRKVVIDLDDQVLDASTELERQENVVQGPMFARRR